MGFGERNFKTKLNVGDIYTSWSRDEPNEIEDGWPPGKNIYGVHPMYLTKEKSGKFNIGFLRTSNAFDFMLFNDSFKIITVGGIIHWRMFLGDEYPNDVVIKYHQYIGGYAIPPFWAMGLHQSRWGFQNFSAIQKIINEYEAHQIPVDAVHLDIDYMYNRQMFQVDQSKFNKANFEKFNKKVIPIVDVGVYPNFSDPIFMEGFNKSIFIRNSVNYFFIGRCWPGTVVFPDFFHPETKFYWEKNLRSLYSYFNYSGLWLDMNEISNFCDGECSDSQNYFIDLYKKFKEEEFEKQFPYIPGFRSLQKRSLALNARHYSNEIELNLHSLNGLMQTYHSYNFLKYNLNQKLPFVLTRGTFAGSGRYAVHWTGDIPSEWSFMELSIPSMFSFNLFGMPMIGSDICGFEGNVTEVLCSRWAQIGSLYPFARSHNHEHAIDQEFHRLGPTLLETARKSLHLRYSLLKYYYMLFLLSKGKGMIIRPLLFEWPYIEHLYYENLIDSQFLIGTDILCIPILTNDSNFTIGFFPNETFYFFRSGEKIEGPFAFLYLPLNESLGLFVREGRILHFQDTSHVLSTKDLDYTLNLFVGLKWGIADGYFIGFSDFSEHNIAECISHDYECVWEIKLELRRLGNFEFEFGIDFLKGENTLLSEDYIRIDEIHIAGLEQGLLDVLSSFGEGEMAVFRDQGYEILRKAQIRIESHKLVIECGFLKNLRENERLVIFFRDKFKVNLWVVAFLLIVMFLLGILENKNEDF